MDHSITVIIPVLNEEDYLPNLLTDLSNQTEQNFEVIVIDAYSEDETCKRVSDFSRKLNIQVIQSSQRNLAYQRNIGAQKAKGCYVVFLDADVHVEDNFIEKLYESINDTGHLSYLPIHIPYSSSIQDEVLYKVLSFFVEMSQVTKKPFAYGPGALFQKDFFHVLGGYDEEAFVYEDHEIIQRAKKKGVQARLLPDVPIYFSMRRFKKEGRISVMNKYLIATLYFLSKGKVDKEVFDYEMGGRAEYLLRKKNNIKLKAIVQKYFDNLKKILEE